MTDIQAARVAGAATASAAFLLFALLAWATATGVIAPWDDAIRAGVHAWASDGATSLALALSFVGSAVVWGPLSIVAVVLFWRLGWRLAALDLTIVMAGAIALENALKYFFARARPDAYFGAAPASDSFPSGHALFAASLYGALACLIAARAGGARTAVALGSGAALLCGAIGLSRIYLGVHYPSDVAAGYLVAIFWIGTVTAVRARADK